MQQAWRHAARAPGDLYATAWACGCVLEPGEPADSPRAMAQAGPRAATLLHRAADVNQQGWDNTMKVEHEGIAEAIAGYVEMARGFEPPDARYLFNHRGHFVFVKPEEQRFVTADWIRSDKAAVEVVDDQQIDIVERPQHASVIEGRVRARARIGLPRHQGRAGLAQFDNRGEPGDLKAERGLGADADGKTGFAGVQRTANHHVSVRRRSADQVV